MRQSLLEVHHSLFHFLLGFTESFLNIYHILLNFVGYISFFTYIRLAKVAFFAKKTKTHAVICTKKSIFVPKNAKKDGN